MSRAPQRESGSPSSREGGVGEPPRPGDGPRFALRFSEGRGRLSLARPLRFAFGTVDVLELDLGELRFPIDLSRGPRRFRGRRTRVLEASVRVDLPSLFLHLTEEPLELQPLALTFERSAADPVRGAASPVLGLALNDAYGTVALDLRVRPEGVRLGVCVAEARAATEGPAPPLVRAIAAARSLGLQRDDATGVLYLERPLGALLTEALVPHGFRVPDDRGCALALEVVSADRTILSTAGASGTRSERPATDEDAALGDRPWEISRLTAPIVGAYLTEGHLSAADHVQRLAERGHLSGEEGAPLRRALAGLRLLDAPLETPSDAGGAPPTERRRVPRSPRPATTAVALWDALAHDDLMRAAELAEALDSAEPCDAVAVEAFCAVADLAARTDLALARRLLARASARRPRDARIALRLLEVHARLGSREELAAALERALSGAEPGPARRTLLKGAAIICELAGVDELAARLWRDAAAVTPDDPEVLGAVARLAARSGDHEEARALHDQAAVAHRRLGDPAGEGAELLDAALAAERAGDPAAAEERLSRAVGLTPREERAPALAALARLRRALGALDAARRAEDRLLEHAQHQPPHRAPEVVLEGLARAAAEALRGGDHLRAQGMLSALRRLAPGDERAARLGAELDAAGDRSLLNAPAALAGLSAARVCRALRAAEDPGAALAGALAAMTPEQGGAVVSALLAGAPGDELVRAASRACDEALAAHLGGRELLVLAEAAPPREEARVRLATRAASRLREAGFQAEGAYALALVGEARRDTAMLRAALRAAERAGRGDVALRVVALALRVVGGGPARSALLATEARLRRELES